MSKKQRWAKTVTASYQTHFISFWWFPKILTVTYKNVLQISEKLYILDFFFGDDCGYIFLHFSLTYFFSSKSAIAYFFWKYFYTLNEYFCWTCLFIGGGYKEVEILVNFWFLLSVSLMFSFYVSKIHCPEKWKWNKFRFLVKREVIVIV